MPLRQKPVQPFARQGLIERVLPFAGTTLLAFALVPLPPAESRPLALALAASLTAAILIAAFLAPWDRLPAWVQALPPLAYLPVVALLRDAEGGGASGYAPLVLLPAIWLALYGSKAELAIAIALTALSLSLPILLIGAPLYPASEWRRMFLLVIIAGIVGVTVQRLVRKQQELSRHLEQLAHADALTELPNRRGWDAHILREVVRAERDGSRLCVALLDLDHFKRFNDELGHPAGQAAAGMRPRLARRASRHRCARSLRRRGVRSGAAQVRARERSRDGRAPASGDSRRADLFGRCRRVAQG